MARSGRRGGLKNRKLKVRILLPALDSVGVAQMEEREPATLEVGSSNLLTHFAWERRRPALPGISARLAEWIQARGCNPR